MTAQDTNPTPRVLVSYPKSGRTWLQFGCNGGNISARFTHADCQVGRPYSQIPSALALSSVVFLHRNPVDTAVSFYYWRMHRVAPPWSVSWFARWPRLALRNALPPRDIDAFVLNQLYGVTKVCAFNRIWIDHISARGDCLAITYEDMRADPTAGFQRLLDFWGEQHVTGEMLANFSSIEKMREAERKGRALAGMGASTGAAARKVRGDDQSAKVRRAVVNGYVDELRPETIAKCREIAAEFGFDA